MSNEPSAELNERIRSVLETLRPFLQADGGDVEFVRTTADGIVFVRFTGACRACPLSMLTLRAGVERALLCEIEEVKRVEQAV